MSERFLIRLNAVDAITLTGFTLTGISLWLISIGELTFALSTLFLAMLADALDGFFARRWEIVREFGRYLDGFVDCFLYLFTPAIWLWQWGFNGLIPALLILAVWISGIVRLSVFNIAGNNKVEGRLVYQGMPVFWLLFIVGAAQIIEWLLGTSIAQIWMYVLWPLSALMMVWNRPFFKFSQLSHILMITVGGATGFALAGLWESQPWQDINAVTFGHAVFLTLPIVIGGVLHMLVVSKGWLASLATPINTPAFGPNKTWRGAVVMPALTLPGYLLFLLICSHATPELYARLSNASAILVGLALGLGYILLELPNSFAKRRLGIAAGETPEKFSWLFILIDQWDSAIGFALAYGLLTQVAWQTLVVMVLIFPLIALAVKRLLYWARWKEKAV